MRKIVGLLVVWGCEDWIPCVAKQTLEQCDEVIACCTPHSQSMIKYKDNTYDILKSFKDIKMLEWNGIQVHSVIKAGILNKMLDMSSIEVGDYIFIRDSDELYDDKSFNLIKDIVKDGTYNEVLFESYYFYINMQNYLISEHDRLLRYDLCNTIKSLRFYPTQQFFAEKKVSYTVPLEQGGMHHYGMLLNPWQKMDMWKEEYIGNNQDKKTTWIKSIYKNYDLNNAEYWSNMNKMLFGIKSPWFSENFKCDDKGIPFKYTGKHPKILDGSGFENIKDFRVKYNFK